jgi:hypothetical protein
VRVRFSVMSRQSQAAQELPAAAQILSFSVRASSPAACALTKSVFSG